MKLFNVVNYHLTENCNYSCGYCFAKFEKGNLLNLGKKQKIIENICRYFCKSNLLGRINFAGGEPLLDRDLDELIDCVYQNGAKVSIVTNGILLTEERIRSWQGKVTCIGVSLDSANKAVN
jgi:radical S-adenosyl methionine domain-containing protein 2